MAFDDQEMTLDDVTRLVEQLVEFLEQQEVYDDSFSFARDLAEQLYEELSVAQE